MAVAPPVRRPGRGRDPGRPGRDGRLLRLQRLPGALGATPRWWPRPATALERWGAGAGASRLVTGSRPVHRDLEEALAAWKGCEAAVTFPTGFAANLGALSVLGGLGGRILSDELNHASIIDGCRLARAEVAVYRHADPDHLEALLARPGPPAVVVTDTVFSMDGDVAPLAGLAAACRRHGALLLLDEAHAVLGPHPGTEVTEDLCVVRVGTLSKTLGSLGGFVAGPARWSTSWSTWRGPTSSPPPRARPTPPARWPLWGWCAGPRAPPSAPGWPATWSGWPRATRAPSSRWCWAPRSGRSRCSEALLAEGLWVPAIRPPTVPEGTSRLRVTLSAAHTDGQVDRLVRALAAASA